MGYMLALGTCIACGQLFGFDPDKVPSIVWKCRKEPVCSECVTKANLHREAAGLELIVPLPGAYEPQGQEPWGDD